MPTGKYEGEYRDVVARLAAIACGDEPSLGAEVGVSTGKTSEKLLRTIPGLTLLMVDPWLGDRPDEDPYRLSGDVMARMSQGESDGAMEQATRRVAFAESQGRVDVMRMTSAEAARVVDYDSLEFVFLDAVHTPESVIEDSCLWWPKVRRGGLIIWHDYGNLTYPGMREAIDTFRESRGESIADCGSRKDVYVAWGRKVS
jgi:hypothetical protein